MKVFRISGRDTSPAHGCATPSGAASMKVFRISGRDQVLNNRIRGVSCGLNESLPHKRKRRSMPPAIDRVVRASMKVFRISGRDRLEFLVALNCQNCKLSER